MLKKSRFQPAMKGRRPISLEIEIPIDFRFKVLENLPEESKIHPPQLLAYYPKESPFFTEQAIILYFDKKPTDVTASFGDVAVRGNNVMITNVYRYKKPYTVKWKGGSVDLVFKNTDLLDSVGEED